MRNGLTPLQWRNRRWRLWILATALAAFATVLLILIISENGNDRSTDTPSIGAEVPGETHDEGEDDGEAGTGDGFTAGDEGLDADAGPSGPAPSTGEERTAALAAQSFITAIDERDTGVLCRLLAPGAFETIDLPEPGDDCATGLEASLGYADPRGFPVWESSNPAGPISASLAVDGTRATVVLTIATRYADDREPTVEDDILYLTRPDEASAWQVEGFGTTLLRAIGTGDIPPEALEPPPGF